jgi:hypothetical protein
MPVMNPRTPIDAQTVRQMAALNGFDLALERAESLVPALQTILEVDARIAALPLNILSAVGLPWGEESVDDDRQL